MVTAGVKAGVEAEVKAGSRHPGEKKKSLSGIEKSSKKCFGAKNFAGVKAGVKK